MQKPLALSLAVCLSLTSCQLVQKSATWETVVSVRPGDSFRQPDPSASYSEKLHRVLLEQGVEHVVVVYQYHYRNNHYEEAVGTRSAVVYRDDADSRYPWWLKDDRTATPIWLPNGELDQQLSFYARRKAEILEKQAYPAGAKTSKASLAHFRPAQVQPKEHVAERPQPVTKIAQAKPAPAPATKPLASSRQVSSESPATPTPAPSPVVVTKIQRPSILAIFKPKPAPVASIADRSDAPLSPPTSLLPALLLPPEPIAELEPREEHLEKLFRAYNGTNYDPGSAMDRRKMERLKHGQPGRE